MKKYDCSANDGVKTCSYKTTLIRATSHWYPVNEEKHSGPYVRVDIKAGRLPFALELRFWDNGKLGGWLVHPTQSCYISVDAAADVSMIHVWDVPR